SLEESYRPGAIKVRPLDEARFPIRPVHLTTGKVQSRWERYFQPTDQCCHPGAVEVRTLDGSNPGTPARAPIGPVHLAASKVQNRPEAGIQAADECCHLGAVQVGPSDFPGILVAPVDEVGPDPASRHKEQTQSRQA